ncbi:MAG TPA: transglutaminase domain-containing protein [Lachnospiraceae bacterium]|nr:transglutaminase domain-containing protein [Lachnospiraceae bacterium]
MIKPISKKLFGASLMIMLVLSLTACSDGLSTEPNSSLHAQKDTVESFPEEAKDIPPEEVPSTAQSKNSTPTRDNSSSVRIPRSDGIVSYSNPTETAVIDASHAEDGYVMVSYSGDNPKVKLQITGSNQITYSYDLHGDGFETFPLTSESGSYTVAVYESLPSGRYSLALSEQIDVTIQDEFGPYLYPNQYVDFDASTKAVTLASDIVSDSSSDLDAVADIYNYVIQNIDYDYDKANTVQSGYLPIIDETLSSKKGICFDYASLMAAMLRSQNIPTRLEIGYASDSYHAWISTYITDIGWINGIIEFDGKDWTLMDPTFAASSSEKALKKFIGDGSNYLTEYVY